MKKQSTSHGAKQSSLVVGVGKYSPEVGKLPAVANDVRAMGKVRDAYLELIMKFPLTSIQGEEDLDAAQEVIDRLLAKGKLMTGEELYLDALSDLVASYEDEHYPIEPASDAEMLQHLMEAKGISQIELHRSTKIAKSTISEILAGKKSFSRSLIRTLSEFFGVEKGVLTNDL